MYRDPLAGPTHVTVMLVDSILRVFKIVKAVSLNVFLQFHHTCFVTQFHLFSHIHYKMKTLFSHHVTFA